MAAASHRAATRSSPVPASSAGPGSVSSPARLAANDENAKIRSGSDGGVGSERASGNVLTVGGSGGKARRMMSRGAEDQDRWLSSPDPTGADGGDGGASRGNSEPSVTIYGSLPSPFLSRSTSTSPTASPPLPSGPGFPNTLAAVFGGEPSRGFGGGGGGGPSVRQSLLRSGGTASHPDLATLLRKAKARTDGDGGDGDRGRDGQRSDRGKMSTGVGGGGVVPEGGHHAPRERRKTETSTSLRRSGTGGGGGAVPSGSSFGTGAGAAGSAKGGAPLVQVGSKGSGSYHSPSPSLGIDEEIMKTIGGSGGKGKGGERSHSKARSRSSNRSDEGYVDVASGGSSWSNTMRKTSGFFRRRFGSGARQAPSLSPSESDPSSPPPVPAVPLAYASPPPRPSTATAASSPAAPPRSPKRASAGSVVGGAPDYPARESSTAYITELISAGRLSGDAARDVPLPPSTAATTPSTVRRRPSSASGASPRIGGPRRGDGTPRRDPIPSFGGPGEGGVVGVGRGMGGLSPAPRRSTRVTNQASPRMDGAKSPSLSGGEMLEPADERAEGVNGEGSQMTRKGSLTRRSDVSSSTEEERLKRDLNTWDIDVDGVLGGINGASPLLNQPTDEAKEQPPRTPTAYPSRGARPLSTEIKTPTRGSSAVNRPRRPRTAGALDDAEEEEEDDPEQSIRLVSSPSTSRAGPSVIAKDHARDGVGLGFDLETINGSHPHKREASQATARAAPNRRLPSEASVDSASTDPIAPPLSSPTVVVSGPSSFGSAPPQPPSLLPPSLAASGKRASFVTLPTADGTEGQRPAGPSRTASTATAGSLAASDHELSVEERARIAAEKCWDDDATFLPRDKVSEWLGSGKPLNNMALQCYMDKLDCTGLRLDLAFRKLCDRLYLKGETQQVDRILEQFSRRFWQQNHSRLYSSVDLVHALCYSLVLLNTDLHVVTSSSRMTRAQFVRNTMGTVRAQADLSTSTSADMSRSRSASTSNVANSGAGLGESSGRSSVEHLPGPPGSSRSKATSRQVRSGSIASWRSHKANDSSPDLAIPIVDSPLTETPSSFPMDAKGIKMWESEVESLLKNMYTAVKAQPIYKSAPPSSTSASASPAQSNSPYGSWDGANRTASRRSYTSLSGQESLLNQSRRASVRGLGSLLTANSTDSVRSSSPTPSAATSMTGGFSGTTLASHPYTHLTSPSVGFASSLSHSIIREQQEDEAAASDASDSNEELSLLGAPWAKEGILQRKHYWESVGRRAKDKTWMQTFVVVSQGELKMFKFGDGGAGGGHRSGGGGGTVGGGNWMANAQSMGEMTMAHALASAMPSGYNRDRPHVFVLTLSGRSSYFFQTGTADLVTEWVSTCNYWAARLSKEPYAGGVSNMEYGWSRVNLDEDNDYPRPSGDDRDERGSIRSAFSGHSYLSRRSKMSFQHSLGSAAAASANPHDRMFIAEWKTPQLPSASSTLGETGQLDSLRRTVNNMQRDLECHNKLRKPMTKLYSPRSANLQKASANWERKSQYLLAEIVKYQTYVEALESAVRLRLKLRDEKRVEKLLSEADDTGMDLELSPSTSSPPERNCSAGPNAAPSPHSPLSSRSSRPAESPLKDGGLARMSRPDSGGVSVATTGTSNSQQYFEAEAGESPSSPRSASPS